jgi:hypothetical protein
MLIAVTASRKRLVLSQIQVFSMIFILESQSQLRLCQEIADNAKFFYIPSFKDVEKEMASGIRSCALHMYGHLAKVKIGQ